jgi:hypothetical protein
MSGPNEGQDWVPSPQASDKQNVTGQLEKVETVRYKMSLILL